MSCITLQLLLLLSATYALPRTRRQAAQETGNSAATGSVPAAPQLPSNFRPAKQINGDKSSQSGHQQNVIPLAPATPKAQVPLHPVMPHVHPPQRFQQDPITTQFVPTEPPKAGPHGAAATAPPVAEAGSPGPGTGGQLPPVDKSVDLDGDGALSLAEVQYAAFVHHGLSSNVVESLFNEVDKNRDGYLTSIEFNDIRPLVLAKAESAAQRYLQTVDTDHNGLLSLKEAQEYILKEYGIGNRDVERVWRLVLPNTDAEMNAILFSKLRRRIRGMSIRLARQIMKYADKNEDGHIDKKEAQQIAFEQEGISAGDVNEMVMSVDDNNDGELNAPEFADFERIVRARAVDTSKKALKVVDRDGSGTLTMDEAKRIAFDHYGFDEKILGPFFAQADENEDGQLDAVEFAGFRSVIRNKAVKNAIDAMQEIDSDGDGHINNSEAVAMARRQDDMDPKETFNLFIVADQDKSGKLDKVELADFLRLVRLSAIKFATDHFKEFDTNKDKLVTIDELEELIELKYKVDRAITRQFFEKVDVDNSGDLSPGELVDFRHEIRRYVTERDSQRAYENKSGDQDGERGSPEVFGDGIPTNNRNSPTAVPLVEQRKLQAANVGTARNSETPIAPKRRKIQTNAVKKEFLQKPVTHPITDPKVATTTTTTTTTIITTTTTVTNPSPATVELSDGGQTIENTNDTPASESTIGPPLSTSASSLLSSTDASSLSPTESSASPDFEEENAQGSTASPPEPVDNADNAIVDAGEREVQVEEEAGSVGDNTAPETNTGDIASATIDAEMNPTTPQDVDSDETTAPADTVTSQGESSREELELEPESEPVQLQHGEELQNEEQIPEQNSGTEVDSVNEDAQEGSTAGPENLPANDRTQDLKQSAEDASQEFLEEDAVAAATREVKGREGSGIEAKPQASAKTRKLSKNTIQH